MRALVVKGQSILLRTRTLGWDNAVEPVHHQNRTKQGSRVNYQCQRWEHLPALVTFKFSAKITHTPGILTPVDFHRDRSGGQVVPKWKSPDVMVRVSFLFPCRWLEIVKIYKTALIYVFHVSIWGAWSIVCGAQPTKSPLWRWDWPYVRHESQYQCRDQSDCPTIVVKHLPILGKFTLYAWFS